VLTAEDQVVLYMRPGCHVCSRVKQFLTDREIPFEARDVDREPLTPRELWSLFNRKAGRLRVPFTALNDGEDVVLGYDPLRLEGVFLNGQLGGWQVSSSVEGERVYDSFDGPVLDETRWVPDDLVPGRVCQQPGARIETGDGGLTITVDEFSEYPEHAPRLPQHQHVSTERFATPPKSRVRFGVAMSVEAKREEHGDPDGVFAAAAIRDSTVGILLGFIATEHRLSALHQRLALPGVTLPEESFSHRILLDVATKAGQQHDYAIDYQHSSGEARWWVDGQCVYWAVLPRPVEGFSLCMALSSSAEMPGQSSAEPAHRHGAMARWQPWHIASG